MSMDNIIADRGQYKSRYPVSYLVLAMRYLLPSLPQTVIKETEIDLETELTCVKHDLTGWGDIILEDKKKREVLYKHLEYREVKIFEPGKESYEYSVYILYDVFRLERLVENTFLKSVNLPAILNEPYISTRMGLPDEITIKEWAVPFSDDTLRTVLHKIEEKYIGLSAKFRDKIRADRIMDTLSFGIEDTFGQEHGRIASRGLDEIIGD